MIGNLFRGYVEGLGSRTLAFILAGVGAALLAPVLFQKFGISPELTFDLLVGIASVVILGVFKQWHIDAMTGGRTTTAFLMTQRALQAAADVSPDHTIVDKIAKQLLEAMQKAQGKEPPAATAPPVLAAVPPVPPSP